MAVTIRRGASLTRAALSDDCGIVGGHHGRGRHRQTLDQPRRRSADDHARHPVGRRVDRFRRGVGARRPAVAHAGRGRDHRQLQDDPQRGRSSTRCRKPTSPPRRCSRTCRPGRTSSTASASRITPSRRSRASRRSDASAPRRASGARSRSCGRATPRARAGASTKRAAACAPMRRCCATGPTSSSIRGDHIYADCPIRAEQKLPNGELWRNIVTEDKSKVARDARGVSRQLQIQPARPQRARVQCRRADVRAMGRPRSHQRLVPGRVAAARGLSREEHPHSSRRAAPRLPRIHADARDAGRGGARLSQDFLRSAARRVHARHALLPAAPTPTTATRADILGADAARLAQARADAFAGDLEGDRRRPADRRGQRRRGGARRRAAARAANARSPTCSRSSSMRACATRSG